MGTGGTIGTRGTKGTLGTTGIKGTNRNQRNHGNFRNHYKYLPYNVSLMRFMIYDFLHEGIAWNPGRGHFFFFFSLTIISGFWYIYTSSLVYLYQSV